jgi:hypothetical protein
VAVARRPRRRDHLEVEAPPVPPPLRPVEVEPEPEVAVEETAPPVELVRPRLRDRLG